MKSIKDGLIGWINEKIEKKTLELQKLLKLREYVEKEGDFDKKI